MRNLHELLGDQGSGQSEDENGPAVAAKRARTSRSRKRRCPPRVRTAVKRPARAHRVTVALSTPNRAATSEGVSNGSTETVGRVIRAHLLAGSTAVIRPNWPVEPVTLRYTPS